MLNARIGGQSKQRLHIYIEIKVIHHLRTPEPMRENCASMITVFHLLSKSLTARMTYVAGRVWIVLGN